MRVRHALRAAASASAIAAVAALALTAPAFAGDVVPRSGITKAQLMNALMRTSDVPTWLGTPGKRQTSYHMPAKLADRPLLCFADGGKDIWGVRPIQRAYVAIPLGGSETVSSELVAANSIYTYASHAKAVKAFAVLVNRGLACPSTASISRTDGSETVAITQSTAAGRTPAFLGYQGISFTQHATLNGSGTTAFVVDAQKYTTFRVAGKAIIRVSLNDATRVAAPVAITAQQQAWVEKEAKTVSKRVAKIS